MGNASTATIGLNLVSESGYLKDGISSQGDIAKCATFPLTR